MHDPTHDWALILAAGEGSRLHSLTTRNGIAVPKQFCSLDGGASLLQEALHRAESIAPRTRIATIVAQQHRRWWDGPLWTLPTRNVVVQPRNRGTGIGILLPLLHLQRRDPDARIALLPSDHFVRDEETLTRSLRAACSSSGRAERAFCCSGSSPMRPTRSSATSFRGVRTRMVRSPSSGLSRSPT